MDVDLSFVYESCFGGVLNVWTGVWVDMDCCLRYPADMAKHLLYDSATCGWMFSYEC